MPKTKTSGKNCIEVQVQRTLDVNLLALVGVSFVTSTEN